MGGVLTGNYMSWGVCSQVMPCWGGGGVFAGITISEPSGGVVLGYMTLLI